MAFRHLDFMVKTGLNMFEMLGGQLGGKDPHSGRRFPGPHSRSNTRGAQNYNQPTVHHIAQSQPQGPESLFQVNRSKQLSRLPQQGG